MILIWLEAMVTEAVDCPKKHIDMQYMGTPQNVREYEIDLTEL